MFGHYVGGCFNNKIWALFISPLSIDNNRKTLAGNWRQGSVSRMQKLPAQSPSWHFGEATYAGSLPYASATTVAWDKRDRETVVNATLPTSPPGHQSLVESQHAILCVMFTALKRAPKWTNPGIPILEIEHDTSNCTLFHVCFGHYGMLAYNILACAVCIIWWKPTEAIKSIANPRLGDWQWIFQHNA